MSQKFLVRIALLTFVCFFSGDSGLSLYKRFLGASLILLIFFFLLLVLGLFLFST